MHFGYYNKKKAKKKEKYVENLKKSIFFYSFQYIFYYIMTSNSRKISFFRSFSPQPFISAKPYFYSIKMVRAAGLESARLPTGS